MIVYQHPGLIPLEVWQAVAQLPTLDDFLAQLHAGQIPNLTQAQHFQNLILTGGAATPVNWPHEIKIPGPYAARPGAEAVWAELGWRNPVAIDLGQTRLKVMTRTTSEFFDRDNTPFRDWIAAKLPQNYDGVLLALPVEISPEGAANPSTYPGLEGPLDKIFQPILKNVPFAVVNDALLAARGHPPPNNEKTLVLTCGYGIGAALWL